MSNDTTSRIYSLNEVGNIEITAFKGVMAPSPFSIFLANSLKNNGESIALDIGCGSGILSIALAKLGIKKILAVDIDDRAMKAVAYNACINDVSVGLKETITPFKGDLFEPLTGYEGCLDIIVSNPPTLAAISPIPSYYQAGMDGRSFLDRLILEAPKFLRWNGSLQFTHPAHAGFKKTENLLKNSGFKYEVLDSKAIKFHSFHKYHFEYSERLRFLQDINYKFGDKQDVAIFRASLAL